jgi:hypothetical protein
MANGEISMGVLIEQCDADIKALRDDIKEPENVCQAHRTLAEAVITLLRVAKANLHSQRRAVLIGTMVGAVTGGVAGTVTLLITSGVFLDWLK